MSIRREAVRSRVRTLTAAIAIAVLISLLSAGGVAALSKPGRPIAKRPAGSITAIKVTFVWGKAARATSYELRVYQGSIVKLKKTGIKALTWKSTTALATDANFTWKVRGRNAAGYGPWSGPRPFNITSVAPLVVGDSYGGGKVGYLLRSGDPGYDPNIQHGLVAAAADQSGTDAHWTALRTFDKVGATGTGLFTGSHNTDLIIAAQGPDDLYAARIARLYTSGGYSNWYLPSKDELNKLYLNKDAIGGFQEATYWSSSHYDGPTVWVQFFDGGAQNHQWREMRGAVRAVRRF